MTGPGDELAAVGRGRLRASHADRDRVIDVLKTAFVQGMLTKDEFDARVTRAFASRTYAELAVLTADIRAGLLRAEPPGTAARRPQGTGVDSSQNKFVNRCAAAAVAVLVLEGAFQLGSVGWFLTVVIVMVAGLLVRTKKIS